MTRAELLDRVSTLRAILCECQDTLERLGNSPEFDEDYKLELFKNLDHWHFNIAEIHANELHSDLERLTSNWLT